MRLSQKWGVAAVVLAIGGGACGDDGGPGGGDLSSEEKSALAAALLQADTVTGLGAFASSIVQVVGDVGKLNAGAQAAISRAINEAVRLSASGIAAADYDGVGFAIEYDYDIQGQSFTGFFVGVVGWNGIDASAQTVDELVMVGGFGEGALPSTASGTIEDGDVFSIYWNGTTGFYGIIGTASATSNFSGSSTDCGQTVEGYTFECSYTTGSMAGDFEFEALDDSEASYTQPPIAFSGLPALRMSIVVSDQ
jgi:hypothetical protein